MKSVKVLVLLVFAGLIISFLETQTFSYPPFLNKAKKFGAKDCTFCHVEPEGGTPFNDRGKWLAAEKTKRGADAVDPEWLVDYKEGGAGEKKSGGDAKPPENQPAAGGPVKVDTKILDEYTGEYQLPMFPLVVTREADKLFGQPPGQSKEELVALSETEFNAPHVNAKLKFVRDDKGKVAELIVNVNGQEYKGKKTK